MDYNNGSFLYDYKLFSVLSKRLWIFILTLFSFSFDLCLFFVNIKNIRDLLVVINLLLFSLETTLSRVFNKSFFIQIFHNLFLKAAGRDSEVATILVDCME